MASVENKLATLNKGWNIVEKIIAVLLAAGSLIILYNDISIIAGIVGSPYSSSSTYIGLLRIHHLPVLLSLIGIFGGFMMMFSDRRGWFLSLIATFMFGILFYLSSRSNAANSQLAFAAFYKSYGITAIVCFALFIVLLAKGFRVKYQPAAKNWLWLALIVLVLIIDKLVF